MSRRDDARALVPLGKLAPEKVVEMSLQAIGLRRTGHSWGTISSQLGRSQIEVEALARQGYEHFLGQQDADTLRAESEDQLLSIVRAVNIDLALADSIAERNALYRTLLAAIAQRDRLLGLNIRAGGDDD